MSSHEDVPGKLEMKETEGWLGMIAVRRYERQIQKMDAHSLEKIAQDLHVRTARLSEVVRQLQVAKEKIENDSGYDILQKAGIGALVAALVGVLFNQEALEGINVTFATAIGMGGISGAVSMAKIYALPGSPGPALTFARRCLRRSLILKEKVSEVQRSRGR